MGFFRKQLIDIIEWLDETSNTLGYKCDFEDNEIQSGAQLTVRQGQVALFVDKGQIADVFGPGMYELKTENMPILADLKGWPYGFKSPFKSDVYFLSMKECLNNKWGTGSPIWIPDTQFGQVQIRAYGNYTFKIDNPVTFLTEVVGTKSVYKTSDIGEQLKGIIISEFSDIIGSLNLTVVQLASNYNELGEALEETLQSSFKKLGLSLTSFTIANIGLPPEIEKHLNELTGMNILGSVGNDKLNKIQILRQLDIMGKAAENPSSNSMMQAGMGMTMGMQMGNSFANNISNLNQVQSQDEPSQTAQKLRTTDEVENTIVCPSCSANIKAGSKFCPECGTKVEIVKKNKFCPECGTPAPEGTKFCMECGSKIGV